MCLIGSCTCVVSDARVRLPETFLFVLHKVKRMSLRMYSVFYRGVHTLNACPSEIFGNSVSLFLQQMATGLPREHEMYLYVDE